jgi:hypothetical protein
MLKATEDLLRAAELLMAAKSQEQVKEAMDAARKSQADFEVAAQADEAEELEREDCWNKAKANAERAMEIARIWKDSSLGAKFTT